MIVSKKKLIEVALPLEEARAASFARLEFLVEKDEAHSELKQVDDPNAVVRIDASAHAGFDATEFRTASEIARIFNRIFGYFAER